MSRYHDFNAPVDQPKDCRYIHEAGLGKLDATYWRNDVSQAISAALREIELEVKRDGNDPVPESLEVGIIRASGVSEQYRLGVAIRALVINK